MRLIDADKLIERIEEITSTQMMKVLVEDWINSEPTAYDVEKVVVQLDELKDKALKRREELIELNSYNNIILKNIEYERGREYAFDDAIDIVKAGVID